MTAATALAVCMVIATGIFAQSSSNHGIGMAVVAYYVAALLGCLLRNRDEAHWRDLSREREDVARRTLALTMRENAIVGNLHDAVANKLSAALLLLDSNQDMDVSQEPKIRDLLSEALSVIRTLLSDEEVGESELSSKSFSERLSAIMQGGDDYCSRLGLRGSSTLHVSAAGCDAWSGCVYVQTVIVELIEELYINISKYADTSRAQYNLETMVNDDECLITEYNAANNVRYTDSLLSSRRGLDMLSQRIKHIDGTLIYGFRDDMWVVTCHIPLPA